MRLLASQTPRCSSFVSTTGTRAVRAASMQPNFPDRPGLSGRSFAQVFSGDAATHPGFGCSACTGRTESVISHGGSVSSHLVGVFLAGYSDLCPGRWSWGQPSSKLFRSVLRPQSTQASSRCSRWLAIDDQPLRRAASQSITGAQGPIPCASSPSRGACRSWWRGCQCVL